MTKITGMTRVTGMTKMTRVTRVTWMTRVITDLKLGWTERWRTATGNKSCLIWG